MFAEVRFRLAGGENPLILVPARVNERGPYSFILDTGAGTSLLSPRLAAELSVRAIGTKQGTGAAGQVPVELANVESLAIGDAKRERMPVAITAEVDRIAGAVGERIDGDIGYDFLKAFRVGIDYGKQVVRLSQGAYEVVGPVDPRRAEVAFRLASPRKPLVLVPAFVNGRGPYQFAVDTGASRTVLSPELASTLGVETTNAIPLTGAGGMLQATVGRIASLAVGGAVLEELQVVVSGFLATIGQAVEARLDGIVGYNFLRRFRVTLDYPNALLVLARSA